MAEEAKWKSLWEKNQISKVKLPELKAYLKSVGLPMNGEINAVVRRVTMHLDVKFLDLFVLQDGVKTTPHGLKPPQIRKILAQLGMDVMGDKDELHFSLIEYLKKKKSGGSGSGSGGTDGGATGTYS